MTIAWTRVQRNAVERIFDDHPADSGRCREAAAAVLPIATQVDPCARTVKVVPADPRAPFVNPRIPLKRQWHYHCTTEASEHYVDVLTGPDGTKTDQYRTTHWQYPDAIAFEAI